MKVISWIFLLIVFLSSFLSILQAFGFSDAVLSAGSMFFGINKGKKAGGKLIEQAKQAGIELTDHAINRIVNEVIPLGCKSFEETFNRTILKELEKFYQETRLIRDETKEILTTLENDLILDLSQIILDTECAAKRLVFGSLTEAYDYFPYYLKYLYYIVGSTPCQRLTFRDGFPYGKMLTSEQYDIERCEIFSRLNSDVIIKRNDSESLIQAINVYGAVIELNKRYYCYFTYEKYRDALLFETNKIIQLNEGLINDYIKLAERENLFISEKVDENTRDL